MSMRLTGLHRLPADGPRASDGAIGIATPPARRPQCVGGLLLDMCNVLYDDTVWRRWVLQLLSHFGLFTYYRCFFRIWDRDYLDGVHRGQRSFCEAFEAFLLSVGLSQGQIHEIEAACMARRRHLQESVRPLPGVKNTLAQLRHAGLVLGAIANSEHSAGVLEEHLCRLGIRNLFGAIVSSIDLRTTMPDPACYRAALGQMKLPADQVAFVDHDPIELAGAAAIGMPTIAFNSDPDAQADVYLGRFEELLDVVSPPPKKAAA
jgi:HAD superfamily hydrolase (TIGR01509 family)